MIYKSFLTLSVKKLYRIFLKIVCSSFFRKISGTLLYLCDVFTVKQLTSEGKKEYNKYVPFLLSSVFVTILC